MGWKLRMSLMVVFCVESMSDCACSGRVVGVGGWVGGGGGTEKKIHCVRLGAHLFFF